MFVLKRDHLLFLLKTGLLMLFCGYIALVCANRSYAIGIISVDTKLTASTLSTTAGNNVTFTASVTDSQLGATPTGDVAFYDGSTYLGSTTLSETIPVVHSTYPNVVPSIPSDLKTGPCNTSCPYISWGDYTYWFLSETNNSNDYYVVAYDSAGNVSDRWKGFLNRYFTAISVNSSLRTITITGQSGNTTLSWASFANANAQASISTALPVGSHSITFAYPGDVVHAAASSNAVSVTINKQSTDVSLSSASNPSIYSGSVGLTATVNSAATGTITFKDGSTTLGTGTISGGIATFTATALAVGTHSITAEYSGDGSYYSVISSTLSQVVNKATTPFTLTSGTNPSIYTGSILFTATVNAAATGTISIKDGSTVVGTGTLSGGVAAINVSTLTAGSHAITAEYSGDSNYSSATSSGLTQTVNQTTTSVALSSGTSPSVYLDNVIFTATVYAPATGTVTFKDGSTVIGTGTISGGIATASVSSLIVGNHTITAVYNGDTNFAAATSTSLNQIVNQKTTSISLSSGTNPTVYLGSVVFTSTVNASATGTVIFKDGSTVIGTGTISGGTATASISSLSAGSHTITAEYGGDTNFTSGTSSSLTQTVNQAPTAVVLTSADNPSTYLGEIVFKAVVSSSAGGTVSGTVTFKDGGNTIGTGTISAGTATLSVSSLTGGNHTITAVYDETDVNPNYATSTSGGWTQIVNKAATITTVSSSANPSIYLGSVTYTANVSSVAGGIVTGTVTFKDGNTMIGTGTLSGGVATFAAVGLSVGSHTITAVYSGENNYTASTSADFTQTVSKDATTVTVTSGTNPSIYLGNVTYTANVSSVAGGIVTGTVTFKDGSTVIGTGTLSGGVATFVTVGLSVGSHTITGVYSGDSNYTVSTSADLTQTVSKAATTVTVTSGTNPSIYLGNVTFTAAVSSPAGGTISGTVTFKDGSTVLGTGTLSAGQASVSTVALAAGTHTITAVYDGDGSYETSTLSEISQTVNKAATTITVNSSVNPSIYLGNVTYTATVSSVAGGTITGTVTFMDGDTILGTGSLTDGQAAYSTTMLAAGSHSIAVVYSGNSNYEAITSNPLVQIVNKAATLVTVTSVSNPSTVSAGVLLTAKVSSLSGGIVYGSVTFMDGDTILGTRSLSVGEATYSSTDMLPGMHNITVIYNESENYGASLSAAIPQLLLNLHALDINNDQEIHIDDIIAIWFAGTDQQKDFNHDGTVSLLDLQLMLLYLTPQINEL